MKRFGYFFDKIVSLENINNADNSARIGKNRSIKYILEHDNNKEFENQFLSDSLYNLTFKTSKYSCFKIYEPKERIIYKLPYYPDHIYHHALLNVLKPFWEKRYIDQTYSCIKGRGIHKCLKDVRKALRDKKNTIYCLQLDIKKFYPNINHSVLKKIISNKIKERKTLFLINELIHSVNNISGYETKGVPIGNWTSQYFGNIMLSPLDRFCKEKLKCRYYFRYADDIRIFSNNKRYLHNILGKIKKYLRGLKLELKSNWSIRNMKREGTDFLGYVIYHNYVMLRKRIKEKMFRSIRKYKNLNSLYSYQGWLKYASSRNLIRKIKAVSGVFLQNFTSTKRRIKNIYKVFRIEVRNKYFIYEYCDALGRVYHTKSTSKRLLIIMTNK